MKFLTHTTYINTFLGIKFQENMNEIIVEKQDGSTSLDTSEILFLSITAMIAQLIISILGIKIF